MLQSAKGTSANAPRDPANLSPIADKCHLFSVIFFYNTRKFPMRRRLTSCLLPDQGSIGLQAPLQNFAAKRTLKTLYKSSSVRSCGKTHGREESSSHKNQKCCPQYKFPLSWRQYKSFGVQIQNTNHSVQSEWNSGGLTWSPPGGSRRCN